jgi:hypothetical protein
MNIIFSYILSICSQGTDRITLLLESARLPILTFALEGQKEQKEQKEQHCCLSYLRVPLALSVCRWKATWLFVPSLVAIRGLTSVLIYNTSLCMAERLECLVFFDSKAVCDILLIQCNMGRRTC